MRTSTGPEYPRTRRALFVSALLTISLVLAPATLAPAGLAPADGGVWPFSLVPPGARPGVVPTAEEAGNVVRVQFRLGGYRGLDVLKPRAPLSMAADCQSRSPRTAAAPAIAARGLLTYDRITEIYTFWWPRAAEWVGDCRTLVLRLSDGSAHLVLVLFEESTTRVVV